MADAIDEIISDLIGREGRYSNHPSDAGGETMWGITADEARASGYTGAMRAMPRVTAETIYRAKYVTKPGFDRVLALSPEIAAELIDTGVNMGPAVASMFLQRALNALNNQGRLYRDITVDGQVGPGTLNALTAFLARRKADGVKVLLRALNCLQGERYIELAEKRTANEDFLFGWLLNRVV